MLSCPNTYALNNPPCNADYITGEDPLADYLSLLETFGIDIPAEPEVVS